MAGYPDGAFVAPPMLIPWVKNKTLSCLPIRQDRASPTANSVYTIGHVPMCAENDQSVGINRWSLNERAKNWSKLRGYRV